MDMRAGEGETEAAISAAASAQLTDVPQGAFALAGAAVGLLLIGWLLVYVFIFVPRGPVG